jgi:3-hydroxyacyl-[acyl-carrier-protein] dehydratase
MTRATFTIAAEHPCLPGHFPGRPVVPGVLLLQTVADLAGRELPGCRLAAVPAVKFTAAVAPGAEVVVQFDPPRAGVALTFRCEIRGKTVAQGSLMFERGT